MRGWRLAGVVGLLLLAGGCTRRLDAPAAETGAAGGCRLPVVKLSGNQFDDPDGLSLAESRSARRTGIAPRPAAEATSRSLVDDFARRQRGARTRILVLSGGSLNGAFGAGLFYGWQEAEGKVPDYDIVTGVSTGALQSTFVFLANAPLQPRAARYAETAYLRDRRPAPMAGSSASPAAMLAAPGTSYLGDLVQDYAPDREADLLRLYPLQRWSPNKAGMLELVPHLSTATMAPLRRLLAAQIDDAALAAIAAAAHDRARPRKLYVAIADLVNGYGYAADLTKLAELAVFANESPAEAARVFPGWRPGRRSDLKAAARECYVDALIASSSVPPGAPPVSIEVIKEDAFGAIRDPNHTDIVAAQHIFVDGGAAFAVFLSQLHNEAVNRTAVDMDMIVNGGYYPALWKPYLRDAARSHKINDVHTTALAIALASADVLQGQIRMFSVQEARRWAASRGTFRWAFISNHRITPDAAGIDRWQLLGPGYGRDALEWRYPLGGAALSCNGWHDRDDAESAPMQFRPRYMRCLIDYGRARGRNPWLRWNLCLPANSPLCPRRPAP